MPPSRHCSNERQSPARCVRRTYDRGRRERRGCGDNGTRNRPTPLAACRVMGCMVAGSLRLERSLTMRLPALEPRDAPVMGRWGHATLSHLLSIVSNGPYRLFARSGQVNGLGPSRVGVRLSAAGQPPGRQWPVAGGYLDVSSLSRRHAASVRQTVILMPWCCQLSLFTSGCRERRISARSRLRSCLQPRDCGANSLNRPGVPSV
jgi:hypothetical protein